MGEGEAAQASRTVKTVPLGMPMGYNKLSSLDIWRLRIFLLTKKLAPGGTIGRA